MGAVNSAFASRVLHKLNPTINIKTNDVKRLPSVPESHDRARLGQLSRLAVRLAKALDSTRLTSSQYNQAGTNSGSLLELAARRIRDAELVDCGLSLIQGAIDQCVNSAFRFEESSAGEFRRPYSSYPLVDGYTQRLPLIDVPPELAAVFEPPATDTVSPNADLIDKMRRLYESSEHNEADYEPQTDAESEAVGDIFEARNLLEHIAHETNTHVISVYWIVSLHSQQCGWINRRNRRTEVERILSACTLHAIGHAWRAQNQAPARVPVDMVFPLRGLSNVKLPDCVWQELRCLLGNSESEHLEIELRESIGKSIEAWVDSDFFKRHASDFNKRPIAWHLKMQETIGRERIGISTLLYYPSLSVGTLPAIQSQHIRPQRQRYETEIRGIESVPQAARSERQQERLSELTDLIAELRIFDERLEEVSRSGFGPDKFRPQLRQYAIDDAMLCLKAQWLHKLSGAICVGPLAGWRGKANGSKLHPSLAQWIEDSMSRLGRHCSAVGPSAPKAEILHDDPTSAVLASLICRKPDEMLQSALKLACIDWWRPLAEAVLAPIRAQIKAAKDELKALKEEDYGKAEDPFKRRKEIDARTKELKDDIKRWERDLNEKTAAADKLRDEIMAWKCPEARTWEDWLAAQPMYDAISGLDGVHQSPQTVAEWVAQESAYAPDINDGVRVNIAPLQKAGILAAEVLAAKDVDKAIADRAEWRADERHWCREGKLPQPGWWRMEKTNASGQD